MTKKPQKVWWEPALTVFGEVTGWIVIPIVAALFLGRYLDEKYHKEPIYFLGLTGLAFIITCTGIAKIGAKYIRQMEEEGRKEKGKQANKEEITNTEQKNQDNDSRRNGNNPK